MTEDERIKQFIDTMMRGDAPREEDEDLAAAVTCIYAKSAWERAEGEGISFDSSNRWSRFRARLPKTKREKDALLDVIMERSYAEEKLELSTARVAKAAAILGFEKLNAFTATCAYETFQQLSNTSYNGRKKHNTERR